MFPNVAIQLLIPRISFYKINFPSLSIKRCKPLFFFTAEREAAIPNAEWVTCPCSCRQGPRERTPPRGLAGNGRRATTRKLQIRGEQSSRAMAPEQSRDCAPLRPGSARSQVPRALTALCPSGRHGRRDPPPDRPRGLSAAEQRPEAAEGDPVPSPAPPHAHSSGYRFSLQEGAG